VHPYLVDNLTCTRCGPGFGLLLRVDCMRQGSVRDGTLGCPNCRDAFPIRGGFADLRAPPRGPMERGLARRPEEGTNDHRSLGLGLDPGWTTGDGGLDTEARALVVLSGIMGGAGIAVLSGRAAAFGFGFAALLPELQVVGIDPGLADWPYSPAWSRFTSRPGLPFRTGSVRGIVLDGALGTNLVREAGRILMRRARLVVIRPCPKFSAELDREGFSCRMVGGAIVADLHEPGSKFAQTR